MYATMASGTETSSDLQKRDDSSLGALKRQGSIRKVLPPVPGAADPSKLIDRPGGLSGGSEVRTSPQYAPYFLEYSIMTEFNMLRSCEIPGIYMIPSAKSPLDWFGVMFVRQGLFEGGVFRFMLHVPDTFPDCDCPKVDFQTSVFHPLICPKNGYLDVARAFPDWNKSIDRIWQIIEFVRRAFIEIDTKHPVNAEAAHLYDNSPEEFAKAVEECVRDSQQHLYDPPLSDDPHFLSFEPYDEKVHDKVKQDMLNHCSPEQDIAISPGLSWLRPGSLKPFSQPATSTMPV